VIFDYDFSKIMIKNHVFDQGALSDLANTERTFLMFHPLIKTGRKAVPYEFFHKDNFLKNSKVTLGGNYNRK